jgi:hypothetical protein
MKEKILKEALEWFEQHNDKKNIFVEDFIDMVVDKTTDALFDEINNSLKKEFENGNLKHPFIISNDYYLYLKLKEIRNKCSTKNLAISIENPD